MPTQTSNVKTSKASQPTTNAKEIKLISKESADTLNRPKKPSISLESITSARRAFAAAIPKPSAVPPPPSQQQQNKQLSSRDVVLNMKSKEGTALRVLSKVEYFFVKESINFTLFYENVIYTYELYDIHGARVLIAVEICDPTNITSPIGKLCKQCPNWSSSLTGYTFTIPIVNASGAELMRLFGKTSPKFRLTKSNLAQLEVQNETEVFGCVIEEADEPSNVRCYSICNSDGDLIYNIKSTKNAGSVGTDMTEAEFFIFSPTSPNSEASTTTANTNISATTNVTNSRPNNEKEVGKISMNWSHHLLKHIFPSAKNYGIHFPPSCDVKIKAVLIGALFLIDYQFYERKKFVVGGNSWELIDDVVP